DRMVGRSAVDRAQFDDEEQHVALRQRLRQSGSARETGYTARAAEAEDGQTLHDRREAEAIGEHRIEARYRKAGGGKRDDGLDVGEPYSRLAGALPRHAFKKIGGILLKYGCA